MKFYSDLDSENELGSTKMEADELVNLQLGEFIIGVYGYTSGKSKKNQISGSPVLQGLGFLVAKYV